MYGTCFLYRDSARLQVRMQTPESAHKSVTRDRYAFSLLLGFKIDQFRKSVLISEHRKKKHVLD